MRQLLKRPRTDGGVVETVSKELVGRRRLLFLCFDEFQLNDIGKDTHA
jgi:predicted ATPase